MNYTQFDSVHTVKTKKGDKHGVGNISLCLFGISVSRNGTSTGKG